MCLVFTNGFLSEFILIHLLLTFPSKAVTFVIKSQPTYSFQALDPLPFYTPFWDLTALRFLRSHLTCLVAVLSAQNCSWTHTVPLYLLADLCFPFILPPLALVWSNHHFSHQFDSSNNIFLCASNLSITLLFPFSFQQALYISHVPPFSCLPSQCNHFSWSCTLWMFSTQFSLLPSSLFLTLGICFHPPFSLGFPGAPAPAHVKSTTFNL